MIKKSYAVLGLGRYGISVARELVNNGVDVIAVDKDEALVNEAICEIPFCKCADVTDPEVMKQLGIENIDVVIIAMAGNLESCVMAITLCKELGVKTVIAKCASSMHQKILLRVGADKVVFPENESGIRLAKNLLSSGFVDMLSLSDEVSIVEVEPREEWIGKSLMNLNLRKKYSINVVAIRHGDNIIVNINPEEPLDATSKLVIIGNTSILGKLF